MLQGNSKQFSAVRLCSFSARIRPLFSSYISSSTRESRAPALDQKMGASDSDGGASSFSRIVRAVGLQIISDLMKTLWAFAVASDVPTDTFGPSQLDAHLRFTGMEIGDDLLSFHLLAIPPFNEQHSRESIPHVW